MMSFELLKLLTVFLDSQDSNTQFYGSHLDELLAACDSHECNWERTSDELISLSKIFLGTYNI